MAVVRPGRSSPPYALIIFIVLWLLSTGLAVYLYTALDKNNQERAAEKAKYQKWVAASEQTMADKLALEGKDGKMTALAVANAQRNRLMELITGASVGPVDDVLNNGTSTLASLAAPTGQSAGNFKYPSLIAAATSLSQELTAERQKGVTLSANLEALNAQIKTANDQYKAAIDAANQAIEQRKAEIATLTANLARSESAMTDTKGGYERQISSLKAETEKMQRELLAKQTALQDEIARKDGIIKQKNKEIELRTPSVKTLAGMEPDGRIIRASVGSEEVWINLGRKDHVTPGMTFTVYDPKQGVGSGPDGAGKAHLEVVQVGEDQSMARVTRLQKSQNIMIDDVIANAVYNRDKNRKFHFVLFGDFDLDGDGAATASERDRLVRLVQSWGGVVDDKLTTQTDFLVMGTPPASPANKFDTPTDQTTDLNNQRADRQKEYQNMIVQAKDFSVPVLNANRFLALIGYYNTTLVRY